jgi:hypothetical protein
MKKTISLLRFSIIGVISVAACRHTSKTIAVHNNQVVETQQSQTKVVVDTLKTYVSTQLHISLQYPATWSQMQTVNVVNNTGTAVSTEVQFEDTLERKRLLLIYHPAPAGGSLYQYALQQYNEGKGWYAENKKEIQVAGKKALVATSKVTKNGKGIMLSMPLKTVVVVFLDLQNTGEYELQFTVPDDGSIDDKEFQHVLSSVKLIQ